MKLQHNNIKMSSEAFVCELDPDTKTSLKIYLFKDVRNVEVIRQNILKSVWKCAVVKPSLILDPFQIAIAANSAVVSQKFNTMVTRTVFAEILYNLSLSKNISQSLSKFGIEKDENLLVCFLITADKDDSDEIISQIEGELCNISELDNFTDLKALKDAYKLNKVNLQCKDDILDIVVSRMLTKKFVPY